MYKCPGTGGTVAPWPTSEDKPTPLLEKQNLHCTRLYANTYIIHYHTNTRWDFCVGADYAFPEECTESPSPCLPEWGYSSSVPPLLLLGWRWCSHSYPAADIFCCGQLGRRKESCKYRTLVCFSYLTAPPPGITNAFLRSTQLLGTNGICTGSSFWLQ